QGNQAALPRVEFRPRNFFHPPSPREERNDGSNAKECLSNRRVGRGYPRGLKQTNGESAENCLDDDRTKGSDAEPFHPAAFLNKPCPYSYGDRQTLRRT